MVPISQMEEAAVQIHDMSQEMTEPQLFSLFVFHCGKRYMARNLLFCPFLSVKFSNMK